MSNPYTMEEEILRGYILNWIKAGGYRKIPLYQPEATQKGPDHYWIWLADFMAREIFSAIHRGEVLLVEPACDMEAIGEAMIHMGIHLVEARRTFDAATQGMAFPPSGDRDLTTIKIKPGRHDAMLDATHEELEQIAIGNDMLDDLTEYPSDGASVGNIRAFYILEWERRTGKKWPRGNNEHPEPDK